VTLYRLYNPNNFEHFYTASYQEAKTLLEAGWGDYEGVAWTSPGKSSKPVYRLYQPTLRDHHYTTDKHEVKVLTTQHGWQNEGIKWYSSDDKAVPVYRAFKPGLATGAHNYTKDGHEQQVLTTDRGWNNEGIGWYGTKQKAKSNQDASLKRIYKESLKTRVRNEARVDATNRYIIDATIGVVPTVTIPNQFWMQDRRDTWYPGMTINWAQDKPSMVIIHEVGAEGGTIDNLVSYEHATQQDAFVHGFVDGNKLEIIADLNKPVKGCGMYGNQYGLQIEQMRVTDRDAFARQLATLAKWTAQQLKTYQLGAPKLVSTTSQAYDGNIATHKDISYKWGGTDHVDPDAYWADRGAKYFGQAYDKYAFRNLVNYYYSNL
jgi:hypothetical protein